MGTGNVDVDLDRLSITLLKLLDEYNGSATSSELRDSLGHDHNRSVNYRKDEYLLPEGLVEVEDVENDSSGGLPVQRWSITERGVEVLENYSGEGEKPPVVDRVDSLENQVASVRSGIQDLQRQFDEALAEMEQGGGPGEAESGGDGASSDGQDGSAAGSGRGGQDEMTVTQIRSQLTTLQDDMAGIHQRVQNLEQDGLFTETYRNQLNSALVYAAVAREIFEKEYSEDVIDSLIEDKTEELRFVNPESNPSTE